MHDIAGLSMCACANGRVVDGAADVIVTVGREQGGEKVVLCFSEGRS